MVIESNRIPPHYKFTITEGSAVAFFKVFSKLHALKHEERTSKQIDGMTFPGK